MIGVGAWEPKLGPNPFDIWNACAKCLALVKKRRLQAIHLSAELLVRVTVNTQLAVSVVTRGQQCRRKHRPHDTVS